MTEKAAKQQLRRMMRTFTGGTILHLLAEVYGGLAEDARRAGDEQAARLHREVQAALFVVGVGIDAACPPPE